MINTKIIRCHSRLSRLALAASVTVAATACAPPPVMAAVELEEYKKTKTIEIDVSKAKLFQVKNKIIRTSIGDPGITESLVVAENLIIILGKTQGESTVQIWDDNGGEINMTVIVNCAHIKNLPKPTTFKQANSKNFKPREDELSVPGGATVKILSGFKTQKTSKTVELIAAQSRTFKSKSTIAKVITADPKIAEPVVISKNEVVLLGKERGKTQFELQDTAGNSLALDLVVDRQYGRLLNTAMIFTRFFTRGITHQKPNAVFEAVKVEPLELAEQQTDETITLKQNEQKIYNSKHNLVRLAVADPGNVELKLLTATKLELRANRVGATTVILWDDEGKTKALQMIVAGQKIPKQALAESAAPEQKDAVKAVSGQEVAAQSDQSTGTPKAPQASSVDGLHECEVWRGSRKDVVSVIAGADLDCSKYNSETANNRDVIEINNRGVLALSHSEYSEAINLFETALRIKPDYKNAKTNLAITYNNLALTLQKNPPKAIAHFHNSIYLDPFNTTTADNLEGFLRSQGKNPKAFADRVALGDEAIGNDDTIGGIVEYQAALKLNEDATVRAKLDKATEALRRPGYPLW